MDFILSKVNKKAETKIAIDDEVKIVTKRPNIDDNLQDEEDNPIKRAEEAKKKAKALQSRNVNFPPNSFEYHYN